MAPPIRVTNEDIQKAAEWFEGSFASFHVVHELRKRGLINKGEDEIAARKVTAWLKAQVTIGAYELAGKVGTSNKYARLTPTYLEKKRAAKQEREDIEALKQRFLKALTAATGKEASIRSGGVLNGVPCFNLFVDIEQAKQLTELIEVRARVAAIPSPSVGTYSADCGSCRGYGHFDEEGKPTMDTRCRKCLDCDGTGEHQP
jgi:hypothetical protein